MRYPCISRKIFDNKEGGEPKIEYGSKFVSDGEFQNLEDSFINTVKEFSKHNKIILVYPEVGWWVYQQTKK